MARTPTCMHVHSFRWRFAKQPWAMAVGMQIAILLAVCRGMAEVRHVEHVSLRSAYGSQWLYHSITGENLRLDSEHGLGFDDGGFDFLSPVCHGSPDHSDDPRVAVDMVGGAGSIWVNTLLQESLHRAGPADQPRVFVRDHMSKSSAWLGDLQLEHQPRV